MQNKIIIVVGPKGSGKTHRVRALLNQCDRAVVFDPVHEQAYAEHEVITGNPQALFRGMGKERDKFVVVYRPTVIKVQSNGLIDSPEFEPLVRLCYLRGDVWLVVDEAHLLCNARNCPEMLMVSTLVGRHRELSMILVAQSFSGIHSSIRKNADDFYFWRIIEPSDLDGIQERCGREVMEQVRQLRAVEVDDNEVFKAPGQCLHWSKFRGVVEVTE